MNDQMNDFSQELMDSLRVIAAQGMNQAAAGFSSLLGESLSVVEPTVRIVPLVEIPLMLGGPEEEGVGIYLQVEGDLPGQIILILPYQKAVDLTALIMEVDPASIGALGSLERSALGELGNMTGAFFLNSISELTGLSVRPSPPAVMVDMVGAILDVVIATTGWSGPDVLMFQATFVSGEHESETDFWVIPDPNTLLYAARRLAAKNGQ